MSAGQIWERPDGLRWVEIQTPAIEPSGWRLMVPLVELDDAPDAPPLVVTVDDHKARVHLITSVSDTELGKPVGQLDVDEVSNLRAAIRSLVTT